MARSKFLKDGSIRESEYQKQLLSALKKIPGIYTFRTNVGTLQTSDGRYFNTGIPEGCSDIICFLDPGITVFVELKTPKGKQRDKQKEFQLKLESLHFPYLVLYSNRPIADAIQEIISVAKKSNSRCSVAIRSRTPPNGRQMRIAGT